MQIDATVVAALMTTLAAIIAPVITAAINSKSARMIKRMELFEANVHLAVAELAKGYSELTDNQGYLEPYWAFITAAYKVMALVHDHEIQMNLTDILSQIRNHNGAVDEKITMQFDRLILKISNYLSDK